MTWQSEWDTWLGLPSLLYLECPSQFPPPNRQIGSQNYSPWHVLLVVSYMFKFCKKKKKKLGAYLIFSELDRNCSLAKPRGDPLPSEVTECFITDFAWKKLSPSPCNFFRSSVFPIFPALLLLVLSGTDFLVGMFVLPSHLHVILCKHFYHRSVHTTTSCVFIFSVSWKLHLHWVFFLSLLQHDYIKVIAQV